MAKKTEAQKTAARKPVAEKSTKRRVSSKTSARTAIAKTKKTTARAADPLKVAQKKYDKLALVSRRAQTALDRAKVAETKALDRLTKLREKSIDKTQAK